MIAILPSAGYATRMRPLTDNFPKPLLPVAGRPLIEYALSKLSSAGCVDRAVVVTNERYFGRFEEWKRARQPGMEVALLNDGSTDNEHRMGAVRDVHLALKEGGVDSDFVVLNPDNLFTFDLSLMAAEFRKARGSVISLFDVGSLKQAARMGNPVVGADGRITDFKEKDPSAVSTVCTIGIYFFRKAVLSLFDRHVEEDRPSDRFGDFIAWAHKVEPCYGLLYGPGERWFDIGSVESYGQAQKMEDVGRFM